MSPGESPHIFEQVLQQDSVFSNRKEIEQAYTLCVKTCGGGLSEMLTADKIKVIITDKVKKGIYKI